MNPRILLITTTHDITTDYVILKLRERNVRYFRINTEAFPLHTTAQVTRSNNGHGTIWAGPEGICDLQHIKAVYYRRQRTAEFPADLDQGTREFCSRETTWFLQGAFQSLSHVKWMNHPNAVATAEAKLYQLHCATVIGFRIPDTLTTNDPAAVRTFAASHRGKIIAKPVRSGYITHPEGQSSIFTNTVSSTDLEDLGGLALAPVTFQAHIEKTFDIRVTVIGETVFATAIHSQTDPAARTDWRATTDEHLPHTPHQLPQAIADQCRSLTQRLGLNFGAIDLISTPEDEYVFLEINPSGQWAWLEDTTDIPISETIATWLAEHAQ